MVKQIITKIFQTEDEKEFATEKEALRYEEALRRKNTYDKQWKIDYSAELDNGKTFEVKEYHLKLLKRANIRYEDWGDIACGVCQDGKRPYGNSSWLEDIAEITGLVSEKKYEQFNEDELDEKESDSIYQTLWKAHRDIGICGDILFQNLSIELGIYENTEDYATNWVKTKKDKK